ncbi:MAG: FKBP-type peptidyl-prolyl cis-trans isomerase [Bacteroidales bacterium]|nr:FKBP-type peptidyl-prolyl cis-trans isomerase [Bacteroidales bacterium]
MKKSILFTIAALAALLQSCTLEDKLNICVSQEESIQKYIEKNYADSTVIVTGSGISRIVMVHGSGVAAQKGDSVIFAYKGYTFSNGPYSQFTEGRIKERLGDKHMITGLDEGIVGMLPGEESYIAFSARYGFFDKAAGALKRMTPLIYYVTLENIYR